MRIVFNILVIAAFAVAPVQVLAWGSTGHRASGLIAERHMDADALETARALLDGNDLAFASTWADEVRSLPKTYGHTFNWHYTTWQDDDDAFHAGLENKGTGFLLSQLDEQIATLKNPDNKKADRAFALKFIIHLLGDAHQPLHVGANGDRGGNMCRVLWHGKPSNLHTVWDSDMIEKTNLSYTELADFASQNRSPEQLRQWQSGTIRQWSEESKTLRSRIYPTEVVAPSAPVTYLTYCQDNVDPSAMPKLGYEYSFEFDPVVRERIYQAGIRLAKVLNDAL